MEHKKQLATVLRSATLVLVLFSIITTFYVKVIKKDYVIFTNPDGPETEEYFQELFAE